MPPNTASPLGDSVIPINLLCPLFIGVQRPIKMNHRRRVRGVNYVNIIKVKARAVDLRGPFDLVSAVQTPLSVTISAMVNMAHKKTIISYGALITYKSMGISVIN